MAEDISLDVIKKTQKILGKYVKKPALTEKLLKKPPFRFLHDIVISIVKEIGFLKGLYSPEELVSENVKEKEAKIKFLNKLIDAVKSITKTDITVRASKIVAGLEPTKTNILLQAIGKAIDDKIDTAEYIAQLNSGQGTSEKKKLKKTSPVKDDKSKTSKTKLKDDSVNKIKSKKVNESPRTKTKANTPKESSRTKNKVDKTSKSDTTKKTINLKEEKLIEIAETEISEVTIPNENAMEDNSLKINQDTVLEKQTVNNIDKIQSETIDKESLGLTEKEPKFIKDTINGEIASKEDINNSHLEDTESKNDTQNLVRPKSAKPKNGDRRSSSKHRNSNVDQNETSKPLQVSVNQSQRPNSSLRPPSVRPSSARPGAPRLRPDSALPLQETVVMGNINVIVENVDHMEDEETVVIQTTSDVAEENFNVINMPEDNKGQLVEQILEQIQEEGEGLKTKIDIDWEQDGLHSKDGVVKEISQLRSLIQMLTKTANPLGKLMNYLHEDIDAMHGELQMWTNVKNQLFSEINKQKRLSIESNKPLLSQLDHIQEEIKKQQQEIVTIRSNILKNELRIKELLNI